MEAMQVTVGEPAQAGKKQEASKGLSQQECCARHRQSPQPPSGTQGLALGWAQGRAAQRDCTCSPSPPPRSRRSISQHQRPAPEHSPGSVPGTGWAPSALTTTLGLKILFLFHR